MAKPIKKAANDFRTRIPGCAKIDPSPRASWAGFYEKDTGLDVPMIKTLAKKAKKLKWRNR